MIGTKENILHTALRLFAQNGYEATSVSHIAGELGMTKGALYKHYKNKRDIFDSIVERLFQLDKAQANIYGVPEETFDKAPRSFGNVSIEQIMNFIQGQFRFLTENEFAANVRQMLILEQYRNPNMAKLYQQWLVRGPVSYLEDLIREMMARKIWKPCDPKMLALELYAPFYLLLDTIDADSHKAELLADHLKRLIERSTLP